MTTHTLPRNGAGEPSRRQYLTTGGHMSQHSTFNVKAETSKIRRVTFSNPPLNLVGPDTVTQLACIIDELSSDEQVQVVIFDSSTSGYFFNHADLAQINELATSTRTDSTPSWIGLVTSLTHAPFISIASIRGRTRGGGAEIALAFDLRYASREEAVFCQPEVATGLVPGGGGADRLPRLIGRDRALEAILTSHDYDAERAERYGWVTRALADAELDDFVDAVAARIALFDKQAVMGAKSQINRASLPPESDLRTSWTEFSKSVAWPGFQARLTLFPELIAEIGIDEVERNLGDYLGVANQET
ncbi:enoyl-CoA hydratase/isomerase family protein [Streptomyces sp. NPDC017991]|uniref:enoyl-CoA hydratase/isomerase family protein n=1 Tax=Streptomyces sp. NPDC017991 TaxID=3365026 RepID=UPI00378D9232